MSVNSKTMRKLSVILAACACAAGSARAFAADARTNAPAPQNRVSQESARPRENVTDEQRAKLRDLNEKFRNEQNSLYEKLRNARRELDQTAQADATDEKAIRSKAAVLGQIEGDLAILRARHYKELRAILPHDQAARQSGMISGTNQVNSRLKDVVRPAPRTNLAVPLPSATPQK
jgi:Spy/CpxP family protein refolding chaperone